MFSTRWQQIIEWKTKIHIMFSTRCFCVSPGVKYKTQINSKWQKNVRTFWSIWWMILILITQNLKSQKHGSDSGKVQSLTNQATRFLMIRFPTPDADEFWQARQREEKLDEGAIAYFQEEEEEINRYLKSMDQPDSWWPHKLKAEYFEERSKQKRPNLPPVLQAADQPKVDSPKTKPRLWTTAKPSASICVFGTNSPEIVDLTISSDSERQWNHLISFCLCWLIILG